MERTQFQVGIIGYGLSAITFHIPFIRASPDFRLHSVVRRQPRSGKPDDTKVLDGVKVHRTVDSILRDEHVQVIVIATPPETHFDLATSSLNAGKHVVVEKPFTPTFAEAQALVSLARGRKLLLTVYHNRRWDCDFLALRTLKEQGTLGRIVEVESHFDRFRPSLSVDTWKAHPSPGNSAIYDLGTHLIDQVVHLFGMPCRVTGFVGSQRTAAINTEGLEDSFTALLHYDDNGMIATIKAGVISPEEHQLRFWVRGDGGSFRSYGLDPQEAQLKKGMPPSSPDFGVADDGDVNNSRATLTSVKQGPTASPSFIAEPVDLSTVVKKGAGTYGEFYNKLAAALNKNDFTMVPVSAEEAAEVIRLVELARESSISGRTVVV